MNKSQGRQSKKKDGYYSKVQPVRTARNKAKRIRAALALTKSEGHKEKLKACLVKVS